MKLNDIFGGDTPHRHISDLLDLNLNLISKHCAQFLQITQGLPVFKTMESNVPFIKIKARMRKNSTQFSQVFNETFVQHTTQLRQRAIFAHGAPQHDKKQGCFQYYVFAPDGFSFLYNPQVIDSTIYENVYNQTNDTQLISQLLLDNYKAENLPHGIQTGSEILFFDAPWCYAVNVNSVDSYNGLLNMLSTQN